MDEEHDRINRGTGLDAIPVIAVIIAIAIVGTLYISETSGSASVQNGDYKKFVSEEYEFSFEYPSNWHEENTVAFGTFRVSILENSTAGRPQAEIQIYTVPSFGNSLESIWEQIDTTIKNNENMNLLEEKKDIQIKDASGIDFSYRATQENEKNNTIARTILLKRDNSGYSISYYSYEGSHEQLKSQLNTVLDSFTLLE